MCGVKSLWDKNESMDISDSIIIGIITGAGGLIATLAKIQYDGLKKQVVDITARCEKLEARCDAADAKNGELAKENAVLKVKEEQLEEQLESCPVPNCHWRVKKLGV